MSKKEIQDEDELYPEEDEPEDEPEDEEIIDEWEHEPKLDSKEDAEDDEDEKEIIEHDLIHDFGEDEVVSKVRNLKIVAADKRETGDRMSIFECTRLIGDRARHLDNGAPPYFDITNYSSSLEIAYNELLQRCLPMSVIREVSNSEVEVWQAREMIIPKIPDVF